MKKLVFTAQVFGLIAMLPVLVILEMNHVNTALHDNKFYPGGTAKEIKNSHLSAAVNDDMLNEQISIPKEVFLLKKGF